ncbi:MAG: hypothetical protein WBW61_05645 [Rhodanobacteraceae bacterium]
MPWFKCVEDLDPVGAETMRENSDFRKEAIVMAPIFPAIVFVGIVVGIGAEVVVKYFFGT